MTALLTHARVIAAEQQLRQAMLDSDLPQLDSLLADQLVFINHLGQRLNKQDDLAAHRSGLLKITAIEQSATQVQLLGELALVHTRVQIKGCYDGQDASGQFAFSRVWQQQQQTQQPLQVISAHASIIAG